MIVKSQVKTASKNTFDPPKYNRGQVIHFHETKSPVNDCESNVYSGVKSYKQNVEVKGVKNVIFCDWFETTILRSIEVQIRGDETDVELADGLWIKNSFRSSYRYNCIWEVIFLGEVFGTLLTHPKATSIVGNRSQFKVNNEFLYRCDWLDTYKEIMAIAGWSHVSINRLDICIDGAAATNAQSLLLKHTPNRKNTTVWMKGRSEINHSYLPNKQTTGFRIGKPKSDKKATIYEKTSEIGRSGKTYISDAWSQNNLIKSDKVDRFELRLSSKKTKGYDWTRLDDPAYLASILRSETKNWFEFYYKGKDKNKHRTYKNKTMDWIDWESIKGELLPKGQAVAKNGVHRAKRVVKDLMYLNYVESKEIDFSIIRELKNEYSLHSWYESKITYWYKEWDRLKKYRGISSN